MQLTHEISCPIPTRPFFTERLTTAYTYHCVILLEATWCWRVMAISTTLLLDLQHMGKVVVVVVAALLGWP